MSSINGYVTLDEGPPVKVEGDLQESSSGRLQAAETDLERIRGSIRAGRTCLLHDFESGLHLVLLRLEAGGEFSGRPVRG